MDARKKPNAAQKGKKEPVQIRLRRQTFDAVGREMIGLIAATLRDNIIGKQDTEAPAKSDEMVLRSLAQNMSTILG